MLDSMIFYSFKSNDLMDQVAVIHLDSTITCLAFLWPNQRRAIFSFSLVSFRRIHFKAP